MTQIVIDYKFGLVDDWLRRLNNIHNQDRYDESTASNNKYYENVQNSHLHYSSLRTFLGHGLLAYQSG